MYTVIVRSEEVEPGRQGPLLLAIELWSASLAAIALNDSNSDGDTFEAASGPLSATGSTQPTTIARARLADVSAAVLSGMAQKAPSRPGPCGLAG